MILLAVWHAMGFRRISASCTICTRIQKGKMGFEVYKALLLHQFQLCHELVRTSTLTTLQVSLLFVFSTTQQYMLNDPLPTYMILKLWAHGDALHQSECSIPVPFLIRHGATCLYLRQAMNLPPNSPSLNSYNASFTSFSSQQCNQVQLSQVELANSNP